MVLARSRKADEARLDALKESDGATGEPVAEIDELDENINEDNEQEVESEKSADGEDLNDEKVEDMETDAGLE